MSPRKTKVAIYSRRSQEDRADAEDRSTARQIANAKAFAEERGWDVVGTYVDEATSGRNTAKLVHRARLAADAEAKKFTIVIARSVDRLSRDDREGAGFVYTLESAGVTVYEYSTKQLVDVSNPMTRTMLNMRFGFAAQESEQASSRTTEQKHQRMDAGRLNDGRVLGYTNTGEAKKRTRVIEPAESALVNRIFRMAAEGKGILKIARELNAEHVVNPTGQFRRYTDEAGNLVTPPGQKSVKSTWAPSGIRALLANSIYIGKQVYGRTAWCWGDRECTKLGATLKSGAAPTCRRRKHKYVVPEGQWKEADRPELRIIEQPLWDAVQDTRTRRQQVFHGHTDTQGRLHGKPKTEGGIESKYLLSGFLICAQCGGRMSINKRTSKRGRPVVYYVCSTHRQRAGACSVGGSLNAAEAHERVRRMFLDKVLTPEALREAVDAVVKRGNQAAVIAGQKAAQGAEIARLERELANLTRAVASGQRFDSLLTAIADAEKAKKAAMVEVVRLEKLERVARDFDAGAEERKLREELKTWREMLEHSPEQGRVALRQVLQGPIEASYYADDDSWGFAGFATLDGVTYRIFQARVASTLAEEVERLGLTPADISDLLAQELTKLKAERRAGGGPITRRLALRAGSQNAGVAPTSDADRPMCPRGDSNTRHAV